MSLWKSSQRPTEKRERRPTNVHVNDASHTPEIGLFVVVGTRENLWRDKGRCTTARLHAPAGNVPSESKICNENVGIVEGTLEENVLGLQVPMCNGRRAKAVQVCDSLE